MRFDVVTLFPELFAPHLSQGITRRAFESRQVDVRLWSPRDYAADAYRRVDDRPYGGGPGMVMLAEPLTRALAAIRADRADRDGPAPEVVHFTPTGRRLDQALVRQVASGPGAVLLSGHHGDIARWRRERSLERTAKRRPDLVDAARTAGRLSPADERYLASLEL